MTTPNGKRPYQKPAVERISLAGEETAAARICKTATNGGGRNRGAGASCSSGNRFTRCSRQTGS